MSGYIPQEVLFNIFLKLPPKTLIFCSCVSQSWRSVITDPTFITAHLNQPSTHNHKWLILRRYYGTGTQKKERYSLHFDTQTLDLYQELKFPFVDRNEDFKLVGICNGLICLSGLNVFLWNPSIQRVLAVLRTSDVISSYGESPEKYALGFGFDSRVNDYKVVRLLYFEDKSPFKFCRVPKVEVYEVRIGSWRAIEKKPRGEVVKSEWTQAFVNGGIHWVVYRETGKGYRCCILRFDIVKERFSYIGLPNCLASSSPYDLKLGVFGEALSIMLFGWHCFETYVSSVWVLQKCSMLESWTEPIIFNPSQQFAMVLGLRDNGEMIMESKSGEVVLYRPEQQLIEGLGIYGGEGSFYLDTYVQSLALLNEGKGGLENVADVYG